MPRTRRYDKINGYHLEKVERQAWLLEKEARDAQRMLTPFREHEEALSQLIVDMRRCLNVLHGRPADYVEPHRGPMS